MDDGGRCPFTLSGCDGGTVHDDGTVGCAYKQSPDAPCIWIAEVPAGTSPRDFYNGKVIEAHQPAS